MKLLISFIFLCACLPFYGQSKKNISVEFRPTFNHRPLVLEDAWYHLGAGDSILFESLKFYISGIAFYMEDSQVFTEENSYHLMDASKKDGLKIDIQNTKPIRYNSVHFNLGIDSIANTAGALGGDLDPTKGMYWAWQSGYVNLKLEGRSNLCKTRNNEFAFHLGGYLSPYYACQSKVIKSPENGDINIEIPLDEFFAQVDISRQNKVMIPCTEGLSLSNKMIKTFKLISIE